MKTRFHLFFLALPAILLLSACGNKNNDLYTYEKAGFTVELPYELEPQPLELPEAAQRLVEDISADSYVNDEDNFRLIVNYTHYKPILGEISLETAIEGALANMQYLIGNVPFEKSETPIERDGVPGYEVTGHFRLDEQPIVFRSVVFKRDRELWQILALYTGEDTRQAEIVSDIMKSASFKH